MSLQSAVNQLPGQITTSQTALATAITNAVSTLAGVPGGTTLASLLNQINALAAGTNLSALQAALNTAITNSAAPLATAANMSTLQATVNTLNTTVNTLNTKLDTLCATDGASC